MTASTDAPLIGEAITLTITVEAPRGSVVTFDVAEPTQPHLRLTPVSTDVTDIDGTLTRYEQTAVLILLAPGTFTTPPATAQVTLPGAASPQSVPVEPLTFTIASILDPNDLTLRPFGLPYDLTTISPLLVAGVIAGAIVLLVGGWRLRGVIGRLQPRANHFRWGSRTDAGLGALVRLNELWRTAPVTADQYADIADTLREYLSRRFHVAALELTTDEVTAYLARERIMQEYARRELQNILESADLVKFAGERDAAAEMAVRDTIKRAISWVRHVEQSVPGYDA